MHQSVDPRNADRLVGPHPLRSVPQEDFFDQFSLSTPGGSDDQDRGADSPVEGGREAILDLSFFVGQVAEVAVLMELLP